MINPETKSANERFQPTSNASAFSAAKPRRSASRGLHVVVIDNIERRWYDFQHESR
jgi:hypothetical protein